jgi:hypothetical protein
MLGSLKRNFKSFADGLDSLADDFFYWIDCCKGLDVVNYMLLNTQQTEGKADSADVYNSRAWNFLRENDAMRDRFIIFLHKILGVEYDAKGVPIVTFLLPPVDLNKTLHLKTSLKEDIYPPEDRMVDCYNYIARFIKKNPDFYDKYNTHVDEDYAYKESKVDIKILPDELTQQWQLTTPPQNHLYNQNNFHQSPQPKIPKYASPEQTQKACLGQWKNYTPTKASPLPSAQSGKLKRAKKVIFKEFTVGQ